MGRTEITMLIGQSDFDVPAFDASRSILRQRWISGWGRLTNLANPLSVLQFGCIKSVGDKQAGEIR